MQFPGNCQKLDSSQQIVDFVNYHPYPTELVKGSLNKLNCVHVALQILNLDDSPRINRAWLCKDLQVANLQQAMQFFYQLFHSQRSFFVHAAQSRKGLLLFKALWRGHQKTSSRFCTNHNGQYSDFHYSCRYKFIVVVRRTPGTKRYVNQRIQW